jgi:hypothetical protein
MQQKKQQPGRGGGGASPIADDAASVASVESASREQEIRGSGGRGRGRGRRGVGGRGRRGGSKSKGASISKNLSAELEETLATNLRDAEGSDWSKRRDAIESLSKLVAEQPSAMGGARLISIFDRIGTRLNDGNSKVAKSAVESMQRVLSVREMRSNPESMSQMCKMFVPHLTANLMASNKQVSSSFFHSLSHTRTHTHTHSS